MKRNLLLKSALALAIASPLMASAESSLATGGGSAVARLDLQVVIPSVLFLGVGTGADNASISNGTIDTVIFDYTTNADQVGLATPAANIGNSLTGNGSAMPVRVFGNNGQVTITATNPATLDNGADTIPFSEMSVVSDNANLPAPGFSGGTSQPLLAGRVTNQTALWTYSYGNLTAPAAGTYTGRVTYTASTL